jgi:hypothetical protein
MLVAHACNPCYSGGRKQEDQGSRPAWENGSRDPISKMDWRYGSSGRTHALQEQSRAFKPQPHQIKEKRIQQFHTPKCIARREKMSTQKLVHKCSQQSYIIAKKQKQPNVHQETTQK